MDIPLIHNINDAKPGSKTTYDKIKINDGFKILAKLKLFFFQEIPRLEKMLLLIHTLSSGQKLKLAIM